MIKKQNEKDNYYESKKKFISVNRILPLNVGLDAFPFMASFLPPTYYFTLFILYNMEDRYSGYVPTISETGTDPNNPYMICFFCSIAGSIYYLMSSMTYYITSFYNPNIAEKILLQVITLVSSISYIFISIYQMTTSPAQHFSFVFSAFFGIILFQIIVLIRTKQNYSILAILFKFTSIILQIIPLILCAISSNVFNYRVNVTIQAICEYSIVIFLPFFFMSYSKELSKIELIMYI